MGCESCLENGLVFGRCCRVVPLPFTMGCCVSSPGLACVWSAEKGYCNTWECWICTQGYGQAWTIWLEGGYLKVWIPRRPLHILSLAAFHLLIYFLLSKVFLLSQVKHIYNPLHELSSAVSPFSIAIPVRLSCQELNVLVTKRTSMCMCTVIHAQNIFVGLLQSSFLSLKISVHRTRFLYENTRMKLGKKL